MTAADDKVTQLPLGLDRIGRRIDSAWQRICAGEEQWVEGSIELMQALADGRKGLSNQAFGQWLKENNHDHVNPNDRSALINMARDPALAREVLTKTSSRSYRLIWEENESRFSSATKTPDTEPKKKRSHHKKKPGVEQAQRSIDATPEAWEDFKIKALKEGYPSAAAKLGQLIAEHETLDKLLSASAAKSFSEKGALRIEDAIRVHKSRLDKQFEQRVNEEVRRRIAAADNAAREQNKQLRRENMDFQRIIGQRGVFTKAQFRQMQMLCHPDSSASEKTKAELSQILVENEKKLVKSEN